MDKDEALRDLRHHWGEAYRIGEGSGVWRAVRLDNGLTLVATDAHDLRIQIREDYAASPVRRLTEKAGAPGESRSPDAPLTTTCRNRERPEVNDMGGKRPASSPVTRARCVYCGKSKPVTKTGKIRKHYVTGGPTTTAAGQRVVCGGSGRLA